MLDYTMNEANPTVNRQAVPKAGVRTEAGSDGMVSGLAWLTREPLLTHEEECDLAREVRRGDVDARRRLVEANMRLVINIARRYYCVDIPLEDLVQEGAIGLMTATERFDPDRGYRFSTYATHWIKQSISRAIDTKARTIRIPAYVSDALRRIERCRATLIRELGHEPSVEALAEELQIPVVRLAAYLRVMQEPISLDAMSTRDDHVGIWGTLADDSACPPEDTVIDHELRDEIAAILDGLSERECAVMRRRFGFDGEEGQPLQDIGAELGISRERVRQIEATALRRLRAAAKRRRLQEYLAR